MGAELVDPEDVPFDIQKAETPAVIGSPLEIEIAHMITHGATMVGIAKLFDMSEQRIRRLRGRPHVKALIERYRRGVPGQAGADLLYAKFPRAVEKLSTMMDDSDKHVRLAAIKAFTKLCVDMRKMTTANIQVNLLTGLTAQGQAQAKSDSEVYAEATLAHNVVSRALARRKEEQDD